MRGWSSAQVGADLDSEAAPSEFLTMTPAARQRLRDVDDGQAGQVVGRGMKVRMIAPHPLS